VFPHDVETEAEMFQLFPAKKKAGKTGPSQEGGEEVIR